MAGGSRRLDGTAGAALIGILGPRPLGISRSSRPIATRSSSRPRRVGSSSGVFRGRSAGRRSRQQPNSGVGSATGTGTGVATEPANGIRRRQHADVLRPSWRGRGRSEPAVQAAPRSPAGRRPSIEQVRTCPARSSAGARCSSRIGQSDLLAQGGPRRCPRPSSSFSRSGCRGFELLPGTFPCAYRRRCAGDLVAFCLMPGSCVDVCHRRLEDRANGADLGLRQGADLQRVEGAGEAIP